MASDLSHISTPAKVEGYLPPDDGLRKALKGATIVVIPAGVPRKPGVRTFCTGYTFAYLLIIFIIDDSVSLRLILSDEGIYTMDCDQRRLIQGMKLSLLPCY